MPNLSYQEAVSLAAQQISLDSNGNTYYTFGAVGSTLVLTAHHRLEGKVVTFGKQIFVEENRLSCSDSDLVSELRARASRLYSIERIDEKIFGDTPAVNACG